MHNLKANFDKILKTITPFTKNLVNNLGNVPRRGVVPKFSDLEVIALSLTAEAVSIDSQNYLFYLLKGYQSEFKNMISRRCYNDRTKFLEPLLNSIRYNMAQAIDSDDDYFIVDSKPLPVCRISRAKRSKMSQNNFETAPNFGYCAAQDQYYFGYKLHMTSKLSGVINSLTISKASVADINYLKEIKYEIANCTVIGDRGYISTQVQLDLFESVNIKLEVPYRKNQKDFKPIYKPFAKARKRIETTFSQLNDQFMAIRNYAKDFKGFALRILTKISAFTVMQLLNKLNNRPIGHTKYALF